jgi:hypothetical protein
MHPSTTLSISAAIRPRPVKDVSQRLIAFNDRCKNFDELRAVIIKARKLAPADAAQSEPQPARTKAATGEAARRSAAS